MKKKTIIVQYSNESTVKCYYNDYNNDINRYSYIVNNNILFDVRLHPFSTCSVIYDIRVYKKFGRTIIIEYDFEGKLKTIRQEICKNVYGELIKFSVPDSKTVKISNTIKTSSFIDGKVDITDKIYKLTSFNKSTEMDDLSLFNIKLLYGDNFFLYKEYEKELLDIQQKALKISTIYNTREPKYN